MTAIPAPFRRVLGRTAVATALVALLTMGGCGWLKRGGSGYEQSPENRPLEVPPDLDSPAVDTSMAIPDTNLASQRAGQFVQLFDNVDTAWDRLGTELDGMDGVQVKERSKLLSVYTVQFQGQEFLLRIRAEGQGSRITAVGQDGQQLNTGYARQLLDALRARLSN